MAFRQPTYHPPQQRIYSPEEEPRTQAQIQIPESQAQHIADVQEWVLFSPSAASTTDRTYTTSTAKTQTAGHSRISDFGSLHTAAQSGEYDELNEEAIEEEEEDDGELDSLDSHLIDFRAEPSVYREERQGGEISGTVLPTHDGLGSFRLDHTNMGEEVQEQLYAFERFNPRRVKRRRESLELGMLELEDEKAADAERTRRIENWRLEQSRILIEEIQKESRRRKQSMSERRSTLEEREQEDTATLSNVEATTETEEVEVEEHETFWNRITRRVIRDLIGIDDEILSIIFGETLPAGDGVSKVQPARQPLDAVRMVVPSNQYEESSWEYRLLERISRELGILVNQLSEHPGAFSTYLRSQDTPIPYAGLPAIPETARDTILLEDGAKKQQSASTLTTAPTDPQFLPTLQIAIPPVTTPSTLTPSPLSNPESALQPLNQHQLTREEWERDLDIKMVFKYLRSRFTAKFLPTSPEAEVPGLHFSTTTASAAENAARAARVTQHHPLVKRPNTERRRSVEMRTWRVSVPTGGVAHVRKGSSSCVSERVRKVGGKGNLGSGSARHYWDFGGSVGSGSLVASTGAMGSWGEV